MYSQDSENLDQTIRQMACAISKELQGLIALSWQGLKFAPPLGDPLSFASWLISFQPFLDALVLRKIALSLPSPISVTRSDIITSVAFANDTTLAIPSLSAALPLLEQLAVDWKAASNGRLNTEKTVVLPVGDQAGADPLAGIVAWVGVEGFATWAGFPLSASSPPDAYYASLLSRIQHRLTRAIGIYSSHRSQVIYANTHILSLSLHLLSFHPAPSSFLHGLEHALLAFVWGGTKDHPYRKGAVKKEFVFLPTLKGGLGLLSPYDFDRANTLCFLHTPNLNQLALARHCLILFPPPPSSHLSRYLPHFTHISALAHPMVYVPLGKHTHLTLALVSSDQYSKEAPAKSPSSPPLSCPSPRLTSVTLFRRSFPQTHLFNLLSPF
ncbi:hypothetical protein JCM11641_001374 [Rhodosporidiobolus odoratus]